MRYRTFIGKTKQEAYAALNEEKKHDPELKEARLIKDSESIVSSFMGLKQNKVYEIVVGIPEHTIFSHKTKQVTSGKSSLSTNIDTNNSFSPIERSIIKDKKKNITIDEHDTLFAIQSVTKVAEQISQLENSIPKKNFTRQQKLTTSSVQNNNVLTKENELKKELYAIKNEFKELKKLLASQQKQINNTQLLDILQEQRELPNEFEIYQQHIRWIEKYLNEREFSQELIDHIITHLEHTPEILTDKKNILQAVEKYLSQNIPITNISLDNYQYGNEIVFVGPTGVGKTSTIVKLAAHISLMRKKSFRFISIDRYKVGGEIQLEKLAGYMNTQFHAVNKREEFIELCIQNTHDFTFIDTAGKGPKEVVAIQELSHWISMINRPLDIHLVVSATTKVSDLENVCNAYSILNYNHILVTKLDETQTFGSIISLAYKYQKPLSFITDGQEIPQDFEIADSIRLIKESLQ